MSSNPIRLANLRSLNKQEPERGEFIKDLMKEVGVGRYSYWRDLLAGNKSFGEKIARRIEDCLRLPDGWLDVDRSRGQAEPAKPPSAFQDRRQFSESEWATWQAVKMMVPEDELADIRRRHAALEEKVRRDMEAKNAAAAAGAAPAPAPESVPAIREKAKGSRRITSPLSAGHRAAVKKTG